jgi:TPR repeat protein
MPREAVRWFRRAADQGNAAAQTSLGHMYELGKGVPRDSAEAICWYRKAADQGDAAAMLLLGERYESGDGVPQSFVDAHVWYNIAGSISTGQDNHENRQSAMEGRNRAASRMTSAQIAEAQRRAREWKVKP